MDRRLLALAVSTALTAAPSLKPGDVITVNGYLAKVAPHLANARSKKTLKLNYFVSSCLRGSDCRT